MPELLSDEDVGLSGQPTGAMSDADVGIMPMADPSFGVRSNPIAKGVANAIMEGTVNLPKRLLGASDAMRTEGYYDPAPAVEAVTNLAGAGAPFAVRGAAGIFGGKLAQTADLAALERAQNMASKGVARESIWNDTGWFQGVDGKWRFEIPDKGVTVSPGQGNYWGSAVEHPDYFAAYPRTKGYEANIHYGDPRGSYWGGGMDVVAPSRDEMASVALHEMQHATQATEDFASGTNPVEFSNTYMAGVSKRWEQALAAERKILNSRWSSAAQKRGAIDNISQINAQIHAWERNSLLTPEEAYRRTAGEVESRNVQKRMNMTPEERRASPPWTTEDVPAEQQIVRMGGGNEPQLSIRDPALWHGISKVKLPKPVSEMSAVIEPSATAAKEKIIAPAKLQGSELVPLIGDRSAAGGNLVQVNGYPFADPVALQGGHGFMANNAQTGAAWASGEGVATRLGNVVQRAAESGSPVHGVYTAMGERSVDFSHHVSDTLAEMLNHAETTKTARKLFDSRMKNPGKSFPAVGDWPGLDSDKLRAYLQDASGLTRNKFAKMMDTAEFQAKGFPSVAEARFAVTDPRLLNEPLGASGLSIAKLNPKGKTFKLPEGQHISYDANLAGKYIGGLPTSVPKEVMYPDVVSKLEQYREALPGYKPTLDYLMQRTPTGYPVSQTANQKWVDTLSKYLQSRGYKFKKGGRVTPRRQRAQAAAAKYGCSL
jgi:hypothetical protein